MLYDTDFSLSFVDATALNCSLWVMLLTMLNFLQVHLSSSVKRMSTPDTQQEAFSSSGQDAITRSLEVSSEKTPCPGTSEFTAYYDIERTVRMIEDGDYKRVCSKSILRLLED